MNSLAPSSLTSSNLHRSLSDRDLLSTERRLTRARLNSSTSSSNLVSLAATSTSAATSFTSSSASGYLPWDRLQRWIHGIAVLTFDLQLGQTIELTLPNHCKLSDKEKLNLCYLSFPDTNSTHIGDFQYHFRIDHESSHSTNNYQRYNSIVPAALQVDNNSLFGYVNFRQKRDKTKQRGFFQKSLVILSKFPFFSLFLKVVQELAQHYFTCGLSGLESCCYIMDQQWPEVEPGKTLLLPLLDAVFQVRIPTYGDKPFSSSDLIQFRSIVRETTTTSAITSHNNHNKHTVKFPLDDDVDIDTPLDDADDFEVLTEESFLEYNKELERLKQTEPRSPCLIPLLYDVNTYQSLSSVLTHIQILWELVLLNEPMAILGNSPRRCSQTVQALGKILLSIASPSSSLIPPDELK